jgi:hypothetical protein
MPTKAHLIAELKGQGVRGKLSKMSKGELIGLSAQSADSRMKGRGRIELEPLPEEAATRVQPRQKAPRSSYQQFVSDHLKSHGGDMRAVAAAYREQKGGGSGDSHKEFMNATHDYCDQKGGADDSSDSDDDITEYLEGGSHWDDNEFSMSLEPHDDMQGGWFWDSWTPQDKQGAGMLASTFGMMALGAFAPEIMGDSAELGELGEMVSGEAAEAGEAGEAGEMTAAQKSSLADEESSMSQYYKKGGREPKLSDRYNSTVTDASGKRVLSGEARESNELLEGQPNFGKDGSSVTEENALSEGPGSKLKKPAGGEETVTEENSLLDGEETDQPESRIRRNVKKMAKKLKEGKKSAARGIRDEIKQKYGIDVQLKTGETYGQWFKRAGKTAIRSVPGVSLMDVGDMLQTEGKQEEMGKVITDSGEATTAAVGKAAGAVTNNQQKIMEELKRQRERNLAHEWQSARDRRGYNPYLS